MVVHSTVACVGKISSFWILVTTKKHQTTKVATSECFAAVQLNHFVRQLIRLNITLWFTKQGEKVPNGAVFWSSGRPARLLEQACHWLKWSQPVAVCGSSSNASCGGNSRKIIHSSIWDNLRRKPRLRHWATQQKDRTAKNNKRGHWQVPTPTKLPSQL